MKNENFIKNFLRLCFVGAFILIMACEDKQEPSNVPTKPDTTIASVDTFSPAPIEKLVFYEINLRSFGPGCNLKEVEKQLDSIQALGVNVIWLMPIFPIGEEKRVGELGSPYSVKDYTDVNPEFGTFNDLKNLVRAAHKKNIAVILDWVANHTAWDNAWISNTDWYSQDANGNIISPPGTNWADVADLNYNNAQMRIEMIKAMKFWVTQANIDGFRCDAADFVPYSFWRQAIDSLNKIGKKLILLAEGSRNDHFTAGFQLTYAWDFYGKLVNIFSKNEAASGIFSTHTSEYSSVPVGKHKLRYITNHDEYAWTASPVTQYGSKEGSLAAFVITAFMSKVPLIYAGQELAVPNTIPFFSVYPLDWQMNYAIKSQYRRLMKIRKEMKVSDKKMVALNADAKVVAFKLTDTNNAKDSSLIVIVNCRNSQVSYILNADVPRAVKNLITGNNEELPDEITLKPYDYRIYAY
ncbi:MAG: alpha-amylase family glycosyl hydrolase [Bacteroidales bacterium]|nr:alpha-amylase family glycosyl hydrolase [Bacteroidales bacterium]